MRVGAEDVRLIAEDVAELRRVEPAIDRGGHEAGAAAGSELALQPRDEVVGERLDDRRALGGRRPGARALAIGDRLENADAPAAAGLAGHLGRAEAGRRRRRIDEVAARAQLRRSTDSARIEDRRIRRVEAPEAVRPAGAEVAEDLRALEEERSLLLEEGLER